MVYLIPVATFVANLMEELVLMNAFMYVIQDLVQIVIYLDKNLVTAESSNTKYHVAGYKLRRNAVTKFVGKLCLVENIFVINYVIQETANLVR